MSKKSHKFFFDMPECSLSYLKIMQMSDMSKKSHKFFFDMPECSLSYLKIMQMSDMSKKSHKFFFGIPECSISFKCRKKEKGHKSPNLYPFKLFIMEMITSFQAELQEQRVSPLACRQSGTLLSGTYLRWKLHSQELRAQP